MPDIDTFDVKPETFALIGTRRAVQTDVSGGGIHQRRQTQSSVSRNSGERKVRTWRLSWRNGLYQHAKRVRELWSTSLGGSLTLAWTPPDEGSPISVRIVSHDITQRTAQHHEISVALEEAI